MKYRILRKLNHDLNKHYYVLEKKKFLFWEYVTLKRTQEEIEAVLERIQQGSDDAPKVIKEIVIE